jgi:hypothetical protein
MPVDFVAWTVDVGESTILTSPDRDIAEICHVLLLFLVLGARDLVPGAVCLDGSWCSREVTFLGLFEH